MSITLMYAGSNSAAFLYNPRELPDKRRLGESDWEQLPKGKLKTLLDRAYLTHEGVPDSAAFLAAAAHAGLQTQSASPAGQLVHAIRLILSTSEVEYGSSVGTPVTDLLGSYLCALNFAASYSASE